MNPFSGGCHYSGGCDRFTSGCGSCPQVSNPTPNDVSKYTFDVKKRTLRSRQIHVVTPSRWLGDLAQQSPLWPKGTSFSVIPYGLELDEYVPHSKQLSRTQLGLSSDSFVLAFGAEDIANQRKGMHLLIKALQDLPPSNHWEAIVFGGGQLPTGLPAWLKTRQTGYLTSAQEKAQVYSAADVFVMPSLEDNQPQTGMEAMACGTPVIAFDAGGIPEYVRHLETGLLAKRGASEELGRQLLQLEGQPELSESLGKASRDVMEREYALRYQAERYMDLYREILDYSRNSRRRAA